MYLMSDLLKLSIFVGYGHVTPKTKWGMGCTMIYCLIGLPLTLMCIANLGKFFARVFRILYHTCFCGICCICCLSCKKKKVARKMEKHANQNGDNADLQVIGNGQSLVITNDPNIASEKTRKMSTFIPTSAQVYIMNIKKKFNRSLRDDVTVPVYLCLVVMAVYIVFGALLFSLWDGWEFLVGAYFCFVTLTTIGFGDYVPGVVGDGASGAVGTERLILCSVYVILGLALIGMCIDLMQADVLHKLAWVAQKMGIISTTKTKDIEISIPTNTRLVENASPSRAPLLPPQKDFNEQHETLNYEQEIEKFTHTHKQTKTKAKQKASKDSKSSNGKKSKSKKSSKPKPKGEAISSTSDTDDQFLCKPPPAYAEFEEQPSVSPPPTPAVSYYDDLPSHLSSLTPAHQRLSDVSTPKSEAKHKKFLQVAGETSPLRESMLENELEDTNNLVKNEKQISMQMDDSGDEIVLKVSKNAKS